MTNIYILSSDQKNVIDSSFVQRFCIVKKPDATLIIASYGADYTVTIGKYAEEEEAYRVLATLYSELSSGAESYSMPDSRLFGAERWKRDARTKRKGGS